MFINVLADNYYMERPLAMNEPSNRPFIIRSFDAPDKTSFIGGITIKGWQNMAISYIGHGYLKSSVMV